MSISKLMCSSCPLHGIPFNSGETNKMMNAIQFSLQQPGLRPSSIFSFFEDGVLRSIKWLAILPWWKVFSHGLWASSFTWSHLVKFLKKWDLASPSKYLWKHLMNIEWFRNQRHWVWKVCLLFNNTYKSKDDHTKFRPCLIWFDPMLLEDLAKKTCSEAARNGGSVDQSIFNTE